MTRGALAYRLSKTLDAAVARVEESERLETPAEKLGSALAKVIRPGAVKDALSGTWLGHPLHPLVIAVPIGAWTSAWALDLTGVDPVAARRLIGLGVLSAGAAAASGASDYSDTMGAERRVGLVHALANYATVAAYGISWWQRGRGGSGRWAALVGTTTLAVGGYLGGHLSYALGVGVDTNAFEAGPQEWTWVASSADVTEGKLTPVGADGVAVVLTRVDGQAVALGDRCTHRGGPLSEGRLEGGCVVCPWHDSAFDLRDGQVRRGPATRPQPLYEVGEADGSVRIRRTEERSLRTNPA